MRRRLKTLAVWSALLMLKSVAVAQSGVALPDPCDRVKGTQTLKQKTASGGRLEIDCQNGRQHGMHSIWHANGNKQVEGEYKDGWPIGTHRRWHANGQLSSREEIGKRGATLRQIGWDEKGRYNFYGEWSADGEPLYQVAFNEKGRLVMELGVPKSLPKDFPETGDVVPKEILRKASDYVASQVGRKYFEDNYRFSMQASQRGFSEPGSREYRVAFEYSPLKKIGDRGLVTAVVFESPKLKQTYGYVATVIDDDVIEPRITLKQAMRILSRKVKFNPKRVSVVMVTPGGLLPELKTFTWAIYVPTPPGPSGTRGSVAHFVDASTGEIIR